MASWLLVVWNPTAKSLLIAMPFSGMFCIWWLAEVGTSKVKLEIVRENIKWIFSSMLHLLYFFKKKSQYLLDKYFLSLPQLSMPLKVGCVWLCLITVEGTVACDCGIITKALECLFIPLKMTLALDHRAFALICLFCGFLSTGLLPHTGWCIELWHMGVSEINYLSREK